jgi:D-sedoheptulose 7-phosphate isomerase
MKLYTKKYIDKINLNLKKLSNQDFKKFIDHIKNIKKKNNKIIFVGNGGSAAMASHVSVDFTKVCKIRSINFNEADLITCYANDYGYENWVKEALKSYASKNDLIVLFSSSGTSKNMLTAAKYCNQNKLNLVTFTGFNKKNPLGKLSKINFWVNSKEYNIIEMTHHIWVLMTVDYLAKN